MVSKGIEIRDDVVLFIPLYGALDSEEIEIIKPIVPERTSSNKDAQLVTIAHTRA
jgi:hypothetical protein